MTERTDGSDWLDYAVTPEEMRQRAKRSMLNPTDSEALKVLINMRDFYNGSVLNHPEKVGALSVAIQFIERSLTATVPSSGAREEVAALAHPNAAQCDAQGVGNG
jgi:hypothetical protein